MNKNKKRHPIISLQDRDIMEICASVYSTEKVKQSFIDRLGNTELARIRQSLLLIPPASKENSVLVDIGPSTFWFPLYRWLGYSRLIGITKLKPDPNINDFEISKWEYGKSVEIYCCDAEKSAWPLEDQCADVVCCFELLEHLSSDPMGMLAETNRILKYRGVFVLSTPNIASWPSAAKVLTGNNPNNWSQYATDPVLSSVRHHREYTVKEVGWLAEAAGMEIEKLWTPRLVNNWKIQVKRIIVKAIMLLMLGNPRERESLIFLRSKKIDKVVNRHPKWLYKDFLLKQGLV